MKTTEITLGNSQVRQALTDYLLKQGYELESGMMHGNDQEEAYAVCQVKSLDGEKVAYNTGTLEPTFNIGTI